MKPWKNLCETIVGNSANPKGQPGSFPQAKIRKNHPHFIHKFSTGFPRKNPQAYCGLIFFFKISIVFFNSRRSLIRWQSFLFREWSLYDRGRRELFRCSGETRSSYAAEIHDDLAWEYEFFTSFLADEIKGCDAEMLRNYINNKLRSHFAGSVRGDQIF